MYNITKNTTNVVFLNFKEEIKMDFWELIEKGREYYKSGELEKAKKFFDKAEALRDDGKYLVETIYFTKNFEPISFDLNNLDSMETQGYRVEMKAVKILSEQGLIKEDIYKYIADCVPGFDSITV